MAKKRQDSLLAHCIARSIIADAGGESAAREKWGEDAEVLRAASRWQQMRLTVKATPKASRVAAFIVLWALAMKDEKRDGYTITEFQRYYNEGERTAYRNQAEFRELWPEFETPNELARQIVPHLRGKVDATKLPSSVVVTA
jgi:hypothetical protein